MNVCMCVNTYIIFNYALHACMHCIHLHICNYKSSRICIYVCNRKYFLFLLSVATEQIDPVEPANHLPTQPLIDLLLNIPSTTTTPTTPIQTVEKLSFSQLRDILLDAAPLDVDHIRRVNAAEAAFWARSRGVRVADSTEILGFDCGGVRTYVRTR